MVLQRGPQRSVVWGYSDSLNRPIFLAMNNKIYSTMSSSSVDSIGASIWSVTLDAQTEEGPFQVNVTQPLANGTVETITLNDVLFGDVWICSGQSNMGFSLNRMLNASIEIQNANQYPKIRLFAVAQTPASTPQEELISISMRWSLASNITAASGANSAVCWLYGRFIHQALGGRPMGMIHTSWGGTNIELWSPPEVLKECAVNALSFSFRNNIHNERRILFRTERTMLEEIHGSTDKVRVQLNSTDLYNAMIYPFTRMVIKGSIWYQGIVLILMRKHN